MELILLIALAVLIYNKREAIIWPIKQQLRWWQNEKIFRELHQRKTAKKFLQGKFGYDERYKH